MKRKIYGILIICVVGIIGFAGTISASQAPAAADTLKLAPKIININTFFSGEDLTITGELASTEDVIIEITGKDIESAFDLKGRIGPFWMTKGNVTLKNVPALYLLLLPEGQQWEEKSQNLGIGMKHLQERVSTSGSVEVPQDIFKMFSTLKEGEHLYKKIPGAVQYTNATNNTKQFTAVCKLPALIGTGSYQVIATTVDHDGVKNQIKDSFTVKEDGFVKLVDNLASNRRIVYGVSAVIIALCAGLIMGIAFKQSGGGH